MKKLAIVGAIFVFLVVPALATESPIASCPCPAVKIKELVSDLDNVLDRFAQFVSIYRNQVKIKFGAESRYRLEFRNNFNFNDATSEDDAVNLFRNRLNADLALGPYLRVFTEGQDAESVAESDLDRTTAFVDRVDLRQLYLEAKSPFKKIPLLVIAGRQPLAYGDQRFVGYSMWSNVSNLFDAAKIVYAPTPWFQADLWFSQPVMVRRWRANSGKHNDNFYGIYTTVKPFLDQVFDAFLLICHNRDHEIVGEKPGELGQLKEYTTGNRLKGKKWNFDYGIEWAYQFGSRAHDDIQAWAWHNDVGYTFSHLLWNSHPNFEYNHGSGDSDPHDGDYKNFDNLFPSNHAKYGYMDFVSLRNINNVKIGSDLKPHQKIKLSIDYHWFFLDTNGSAWFNASQKVIRAAQLGASTTIGQELDLLGTWQLSAHLDLMMGYSHFHAGAFMKDTGAHDSADFFYTQFTVKV